MVIKTRKDEGLISRRGFDHNPESLHDVQKLTGFIYQLGVRGLPFFKPLKIQDKFQWTQEAQEDFEDLKKYLTTLPTLVPQKPMTTCSFTY
jgi:hypothetical protein